MRIAVTGATGGLGRSLVEFLLKQNVEVVALGRNKIVGAELAKKGAHFLAGDITDIDYLKKAFVNIDVVVHSAGLASPWGDWSLFYEANVKGTEAVVESARFNQVSRIVHISTPSIYFNGLDRKNISEDEPIPNPQNFYAKSKLLADELILKATAEGHFDSTLMRPRAILGPYDATILPRILKVMRKGFFPLPNGGQALVDLTAVENVVFAIWLAIQKKERLSGAAFNISNGEPMTVLRLVEILSDTLGIKIIFISVPLWLIKTLALVFEFYAKLISRKEPLISKYSIESLGTTQTLSIKKAELVLGYKPILTLKEAILGYIEKNNFGAR